MVHLYGSMSADASVHGTTASRCSRKGEAAHRSRCRRRPCAEGEELEAAVVHAPRGEELEAPAVHAPRGRSSRPPPSMRRQGGSGAGARRCGAQPPAAGDLAGRGDLTVAAGLAGRLRWRGAPAGARLVGRLRWRDAPAAAALQGADPRERRESAGVGRRRRLSGGWVGGWGRG
jgi:hypothetical protein